jgi:hypothetical protein
MTKEELFQIDKDLDPKSKKDSMLIQKRGYYVYYNKPNKQDRHLMIHHHTCGNCCFGTGKYSEAEAGLNGIWIGPSETITSLQNHVADIFKEEAQLCSSCINNKKANIQLNKIDTNEINRIIVSAWKNSTQNNLTGAGFGIKISKKDIHLVENWKSIKLGDSNEIFYRDNSFLNFDCPEIRSSKIGSFFIQINRYHWQTENPHKYYLKDLGNENFQLIPIE